MILGPDETKIFHFTTYNLLGLPDVMYLLQSIDGSYFIAKNIDEKMKLYK